jgi:hypothetical protein
MITGNIAPLGSGPDVYNAGVLYWDGSGTFGILDGNPAKEETMMALDTPLPEKP